MDKVASFTCIVCPIGCLLSISREADGSFFVQDNLCIKGREYAYNEYMQPMRSLTSTVRTGSTEMPRLPVRTDGEIPKAKLFLVMSAIEKVYLTSNINIGEVILFDAAGTGVNIIATDDLHCDGRDLRIKCQNLVNIISTDDLHSDY